MTTLAPLGLHHVTAIASDPGRNVEFYTRVLGLRLVKQTVNFDDPGTYHLYYGDEHGSPSSLITFFPWKDVERGRQGTGLVTSTAFSVPGSSLSFWHDRLRELNVRVEAPVTRGDDEVLRLYDHDGMVLDLIASDGDTRSGWDGVASVPTEHAVRGLHSVTLTETTLDATAELLTDRMSMTVAADGAASARFAMAAGGAGALVDVVTDRSDRGLQAGGTVHHVAFRAPDHETLTAWRTELVDSGAHVTEILDRQYFQSIYFREPGGVLFEIATEAPGFDVDEPLLELGRSLKLPPWLEPTREQIEQNLPALPVGDAS
ncbi:ring-cleaving dioxygenase [Rhodococcus sp. UNC23MFCrub1.1]|uniref:ring-cleaving dioxygenase n=1 Tax=Rhodococcus sp. UNC23MFCrub1.1 TaxID=1449068 RepID=UPI0004841C46|nr:ring-cleaving dioxygenase [Rhodococcus sp. UNC23MFCrub1.1]